LLEGKRKKRGTDEEKKRKVPKNILNMQREEDFAEASTWWKSSLLTKEESHLKTFNCLASAMYMKSL
jgi:hypothetical protein